MVRLFSYNDENFTVIGNMLFVHIKITKNIESGSHVVEVPAAIVNRLAYHANTFYSAWSGLDSAFSNVFAGGITESGGKYYIVAGHDLQENCYLITNYWLKDI
jgi:hypothetical protein